MYKNILNYMDTIKVKESFISHGTNFEKHELFYGKWIYTSNINKDNVLNLVAICNEFKGPFLIEKAYFELVK